MRSPRLFALIAIASPLLAQYAGPAILSRGEAPAAMVAPQVSFRPFVSLNAIYDSGLAGVVLTNTSGLADEASAGVSLAWGISGSHSWHHTKVGLDYHGDLNHYLRQTFYDGTDQSLLLAVSHQISRHVLLSLQEYAGMFSRNLQEVGLSQTVPFDPTTTAAPVTDFFDNRTYFLISGADVVIQKTARLSFDLGGVAMLTRRRSSALSDMRGEQARGDVEYRLTRFLSVGGLYTFNTYSYDKTVVADTDVHGFAGSLSYRISRRVEFSGFAGFQRVESKAITQTAVDPVIAALLGTTTANEIVHTLEYTPYFNARISRVFRDGVVFLAAARSVIPGNGLFLSSNSLRFLGGYTYTGLRRWSFSTGSEYTRATSFQNYVGRYDTLSGDLRVARRITAGLHFVAAYSLRRYSSPDFTLYHRLIHEVSVGVGYTPGEIPLRIW